MPTANALAATGADPRVPVGAISTIKLPDENEDV